jgi:hypothetical protein
MGPSEAPSLTRMIVSASRLECLVERSAWILNRTASGVFLRSLNNTALRGLVRDFAVILSKGEGCKGFEMQRGFMVSVFMQGYGNAVLTLVDG